MSFNSRPDLGASEARVDEINEKADEWSREHGDDWQPEPGPVRRVLDAVRAKFRRADPS